MGLKIVVAEAIKFSHSILLNMKEEKLSECTDTQVITDCSCEVIYVRINC